MSGELSDLSLSQVAKKNFICFKGSFSIPDSDAMAESLVIDHNLSLMAVDKSNNATKAVMLNGAFDRAEIDVTRQEVRSGLFGETILNFLFTPP